MKKFRFQNTGSILGTVGGAAVAGGTSAVFDRYVGEYVTSKDGTSYGRYIKAGVGLALPFFSQNMILRRTGDGLLAIGLSEIISGVLPAKVEGIGSRHIAGSRHIGESRRRWSIPLSTSAQRSLENEPRGSQYRMT